MAKSKTSKRYTPEFRRQMAGQMVELHRAGRRISELAVTLAGLELVHRIGKRQFKFGPGRWSRWSLKKQWERALA
jgi:hypothetical protein